MLEIKLSLGRFIWIIKASAWARTGSEFLFLWMTGIDLTGGELMALFLHSSDISRLPEHRLWGRGSDGLKWPRRQATGKNELQLGWQLLKMLMNVSTWRPATHSVLCATRAEPLAAMLSYQQGSSRNYSSHFFFSSPLLLSILSKLPPKKKLESQISVVFLVTWGSQSTFLAGLKRNVRTAKPSMLLHIILFFFNT